MENFANLLATIFQSYFDLTFEGLEQLSPAKHPKLVLVGKHGSFLLDIFSTLMLLKRSQRRCVGLGHDVWFKYPNVFGRNGPVPLIPASPQSFRAAIMNGDAVLVYPGGVDETLGNEDPARRYDLCWNNRQGFARIVLDTTATIVPFFVQNSEEIYFKPLGWLSRFLWSRWRFMFGLPFGIGLFPFPVKLRVVFGPPVKLCRFDPKFAGALLEAEKDLEVTRCVSATRAALEKLIRDKQDIHPSKAVVITRTIQWKLASALVALQVCLLWLLARSHLPSLRFNRVRR
jgi:hypothetical protein